MVHPVHPGHLVCESNNQQKKHGLAKTLRELSQILFFARPVLSPGIRDLSFYARFSRVENTHYLHTYESYFIRYMIAFIYCSSEMSLLFMKSLGSGRVCAVEYGQSDVLKP